MPVEEIRILQVWARRHTLRYGIVHSRLRCVLHILITPTTVHRPSAILNLWNIRAPIRNLPKNKQKNEMRLYSCVI
jgi:hypothetical protein